MRAGLVASIAVRSDSLIPSIFSSQRTGSSCTIGAG